MNHIDRDLLVLVSRAETEFKYKTRPEPEVQREAALAILEMLDRPLVNGSDGSLSAAFRKVAQLRIAQVREGLQSFLDGQGYYAEEDHFHYLAEEVDTILFGPNFYDAFNRFETLFSE